MEVIFSSVRGDASAGRGRSGVLTVGTGSTGDGPSSGSSGGAVSGWVGLSSGESCGVGYWALG